MLTAHLNNLVAQNVSWKFHKISDFFKAPLTIFPFVCHQALKCVLLNSFSFIKNQQQQQNLHESSTG